VKILELRQVSFRYPGQPREALKDISLEIHAGEIVYVCGPTGSGKSTLLNCLKREIRPRGELTGSIIYDGQEMDAYTDAALIQQIGIVFQNPDNQTVMDTVMGEMAFGLENLGLAAGQIKQRLSEIAGYFGIESLFHKSLQHLSGGEKQKVNLCAALAMRPRLLLLDEPLSQLDPIAQTELIGMIRRLNQEFGITIIISEHNKDDMMVRADKVLVLNQGRQCHFGTLRQVVAEVVNSQDENGIAFMPTPARLYVRTAKIPPADLPLTVKEARHMLHVYPIFRYKRNGVSTEARQNHNPALAAENLLFAYRSAPGQAVLKNLDFLAYQGDFIGIVGGNGSGKSTLLKLLAGLLEPMDGMVRIGRDNIRRMKKDVIRGTVFYGPQNPLTYFTQDTVEAELAEASRQGRATAESYGATLRELNLSDLLNMHPYDLSGGERQKILLACAVLRGAQILLLDEATKGLDASVKKELGSVLTELARNGKTIILVSHDLEFMAGFARKCTLLFDGNLSILQSAHDFFRDNYFYTTIAKRIFRESLPDVLTIEEVIADG